MLDFKQISKDIDGFTIHVREASALDLAPMFDEGAQPSDRVLLLAYASAINPDGTRIFASVEEVKAAPFRWVKHYAELAMVVNGITEDDTKN